jgi:hypothetical protein
VNSDSIDQLLYEEEGPTLDFKRDQYAFAKATEEEKSELLKDIIGGRFAGVRLGFRFSVW